MDEPVVHTVGQVNQDGGADGSIGEKGNLQNADEVTESRRENAEQGDENRERGDVKREKTDNDEGDNEKGCSDSVVDDKQGVGVPEHVKEEKAEFKCEEGLEDDSSMPEDVDEGVATKIVNGETETEKQKNKDNDIPDRRSSRLKARVNYAELLDGEEEKARKRRGKHKGKDPKTESKEREDEEKADKRKCIDSAGKGKIISATKQGSKNGQKRKVSDNEENAENKLNRAKTRNKVSGSDFDGKGMRIRSSAKNSAASMKEEQPGPKKRDREKVRCSFYLVLGSPELVLNFV